MSPTEFLTVHQIYLSKLDALRKIYFAELDALSKSWQETTEAWQVDGNKPDAAERRGGKDV